MTTGDNRRGVGSPRPARGAVLVACATVSMVVAGCASIGAEADDAVLSAPDDGDLSGEITIWNRSGDLYQVFDTVIEKFNERYPDIVVNHEAVDIDGVLASTLVAGSDVPDGTFVDDKQVPNLSQHFYNLSEVLEPYREDIIQQKWDVNTVDGDPYAVPWDLNPGLLYYNADALDEAGIDATAIETYDDLLDAARQYKAAVPDSQPIHLEQEPFLGQMWLEMFAHQQGTNLNDADGNLQLDSPEYERILTWLQTVVDEGLGSYNEYVSPGDLATMESGSQVFYPWAIWASFIPQLLLEETTGQWRAMLLPAWTEGGARSGAMGGSSFAIPRDAENPELAWLFFEFLVFDPDGYETVYGPNDIYPGGLNTSIPSYRPALDPANPLFEPIEALGGQDLFEVAVQAADELPGTVPTPAWWPQAVDYLGNNLQLLLEGQATPEEVIEESTNQIQTNLIDRQ